MLRRNQLEWDFCTTVMGRPYTAELHPHPGWLLSIHWHMTIAIHTGQCFGGTEESFDRLDGILLVIIHYVPGTVRAA